MALDNIKTTSGYTQSSGSASDFDVAIDGTTSGNYLVCVANREESWDQAPVVSGGGVTWTQRVSQAGGAHWYGNRCNMVISTSTALPSGGDKTINVAAGGGTANMGAIVFEMQNIVNPATWQDTDSDAGSGESTLSLPTFGDASKDQCFIGAYSCAWYTTPSAAASGWDNEDYESSTAGMKVDSRENTGTVSATWVPGGSHYWAAVGIALEEAPAGGLDLPQGLHGIDKGFNPQRSTRLGGELEH